MGEGTHISSELTVVEHTYSPLHEKLEVNLGDEDEAEQVDSVEIVPRSWQT